MLIRTEPFRRARIVVDRKLQWSLCLHGIVYGVLLLVVVSCGIFAPLLWQLGEQGPNAPLDPEAAVVMIYMHRSFWIVAAAGLVLTTLAALRFSHRIAGPLVRYKRNLRLVADGKLPPDLRTRRGDFLQEEVACLNAAVRGVRDRLDAIRTAQRALAHELERAHDAATAGGAADFGEVLAAERELARCVASFEALDNLDDYLVVPAARPVLQAPVAVGNPVS